MEAKIPALLPSADGAAPCGTSSMASAPVIKIIMLDRKESFANDYDAVVCLLLRWGPGVIVIRLLWSSLMCNWPENCFSSPLFSHTKHTTAAGIFLFFFFKLNRWWRAVPFLFILLPESLSCLVIKNTTALAVDDRDFRVRFINSIISVSVSLCKLSKWRIKNGKWNVSRFGQANNTTLGP